MARPFRPAGATERFCTWEAALRSFPGAALDRQCQHAALLVEWAAF